MNEETKIKDSLTPLLKELNDEQKDAVLSEDKNLLILAGAGSGKTKTLIQKILYLLSKGVDPNDILAITFTKNATNEMIDRLIVNAEDSQEYSNILNSSELSLKKKNFERNKYLKKHPWISNMTVKTFHSLCYSILRDFTSIEQDNKFRILSSEGYSENSDFNSNRKAPESPSDILDKIIKELCSNDKEYLVNLKRYILDYYVEEPRIKINRKSKEIKYKKPYVALDGTEVRSPPERDICDYLFLHNIKYEYEPLIALNKFEQNPDFYIHDANIFLEHVSKSSYPTKDKELEFKLAGKKLIKTYQEDYKENRKDFYLFLDGLILPLLDKEFKKSIPLIVENTFEGISKELNLYKQTILSVVDSLKVESKTISEIYDKSQTEQKRIKEFYELTRPIIEKYLEYCNYYAYLDFNDIIIKAVSLIKKDKSIKNSDKFSYKFILVDEFQDVNTIQVELLKELIKNETQLFCVGDDWQSIYGWRGSEVDYIVNFKNYFENPKIIKLGINYRSNDTIVAASNEVIKNNKFKIDKEVRALENSNKKIYLYEAKLEEEDGVKETITQIRKLLKKGYREEDILILYRRTLHIQPYAKKLKELNLNKIQKKTIHASKGLEAKVVFIIGLKGGIYGFPNVFLSDRIFQIIKKSDYELLQEEERRLFYVALTRAKEYLFLITELGNRSIYVNEIPGEFIETSNFLLLNIENSNKQKICKNCSKNIKDEFMFCPYCGVENNDLETEENIVNNNEKEEKNDNEITFDKNGQIIKIGNTNINDEKEKRKKFIEINKLVIFKAKEINTSMPAIAQLEIKFPKVDLIPNEFTKYCNEYFKANGTEIKKIDELTYSIELKSHLTMYSSFENFAINLNKRFNLKIKTEGKFAKWEWSQFYFGIDEKNLINI